MTPRVADMALDTLQDLPDHEKLGAIELAALKAQRDALEPRFPLNVRKARENEYEFVIGWSETVFGRMVTNDRDTTWLVTIGTDFRCDVHQVEVGDFEEGACVIRAQWSEWWKRAGAPE
jgi:hypothetical protein